MKYIYIVITIIVGVESAEPDLKSSQVSVKGAFEPEKLTDYVHKRTGKHAVIMKVEPEKKKEEEKPKEGKEEKKPEEAEKEAKKEEGGGKDDKPAAAAAAAVEPPTKAEGELVEDPKMELKKNEFFYYYPHQNLQVYPPQRIVQEYYQDYPPQIFSDENPNACSVM